MVHDTMAQMEPKQLTLFFNKHISFSMLEEVEHAIGKIGEAILAWQTCEDNLFCKEIFFFKQISKS